MQTALPSRIRSFLFALVLSFAFSATASAQQYFDFTFSTAGFSGSGVLTATLIGNGDYLVTAVSGTENGLALSLIPQIPQSSQPYLPIPLFGSANYGFTDALYTSDSTLQALDAGGLALQTSAGGFNIYGAGLPLTPSTVAGNSYFFVDDAMVASSTAPAVATFTLTTGSAPVPEPSVFALAVTGVLMLWACRRIARTR